MKRYIEAFRGACATLGAVTERGGAWWPKNQPETTALSWAIGIGLAPDDTRWVYSCWGSRPQLKAAVLDALAVRYRKAGEPGSPNRQGPGKLFYPRQFIVDFTTYRRDGNAIGLALESEAYAEHSVGQSLVDPDLGYNWDFAKLLYLPAQLRVFVARVRAADRRELLWTDLAGILSDGTAFLLDAPIVVYVLPTEYKGELTVGRWNGQQFETAPLGTWQHRA